MSNRDFEADIFDRPDEGFRQRVEAIVSQIPSGRVMTYGQIAALCGNARAARIVGGTAHFGDPNLPWQRVVNKTGGLAAGYPGGRAGHRAALEAEGFKVSDELTVDVANLLWSPVEADRGSTSEDRRADDPEQAEQQGLF
jgi:methylated-DNA-protein-cysteine methyltransferase-like protein